MPILLLCCFMTVSTIALAAVPKVVTVGGGSYAASPPAELLANEHWGEKLKARIARQYEIVDQGDRPVPTNAWFSHIAEEKLTGQLWPHPLRLQTFPLGVMLESFGSWTNAGNAMGNGSVLELRGTAAVVRDRLVRWGDWTVTFRMEQSDTEWIDCTIGRGMPMAWFEFQNLPIATLRVNDDPDARDLDGKAVQLPHTGDTLLVKHQSRWWAIFAPAGTRFSRTNDLLRVEFAGDARHLSITPLPDIDDATRFREHAYAIPRDSRVAWSADPATRSIRTTWTIETEPLQGEARAVLQGWLPHHLRRTTTDVEPIEGIEYLTPRGKLVVSAGNVFQIDWPMPHALFSLPLPENLPAADAARVAGGLDRFAEKFSGKPKDYLDNTYWGGKRVQRYAQAMMLARQTGHPSFAIHRDQLHAAMVDWLTWTPGEKAPFFAYYDNAKALVGFDPAYGSESFTDHHFHYGYLVTAGAMLASIDPEFRKDFGPMLTLLAKQYANWDRDDRRFDFMRTFDVWAGHSYAAGMSSPAGNNQESTSEAINSWLGVLLLGKTLGDPAMADAGMFGLAMESEATLEYWFDIHRENWGPGFQKSNVGILQDWGNAYATFFGAEPAWIYGIQLIPSTPALDFLVTDPAAARRSFDLMLSARVDGGKEGSVESVGGEWCGLIFTQWARFDPAAAMATYRPLIERGFEPLIDEPVALSTLHEMLAREALGTPDPTHSADHPLAICYSNAETRRRTCAAFNPSSEPIIVRVYRSGAVVHTFNVPAGTLHAEPLPE